MTINGTDVIINVHLDIPGMTMKEADFEIMAYVYSNKTQHIKKEDMVMVDENNYKIKVDTLLIGSGTIKIDVLLKKPFETGFIKEIESHDTGITTSRNGVHWN